MEIAANSMNVMKEVEESRQASVNMSVWRRLALKIGGFSESSVDLAELHILKSCQTSP